MGWNTAARASEPTATNAVTAAARAASSAEFQNTAWRMTVAQVKALYPNAVATAQGLSTIIAVEGRQADVSFTFVDDELATARVDFLGTPDTVLSYAQLYQLLGKRFGVPAFNIDPRKTAQHQADLQHEKSDIAAALIGISPPRDSFVVSNAVGIDGDVKYAAATAAIAAMRSPESAVWFVGQGRVELASNPTPGTLSVTYGFRPLENANVGASRVASSR